MAIDAKRISTFSLGIFQKMQLDVGSEPNLSTAQALCLAIGHIFYYRSVANWQRITAMASSESEIFSRNILSNLNFGKVADGLSDSNADQPIGQVSSKSLRYLNKTVRWLVVRSNV